MRSSLLPSHRTLCSRDMLRRRTHRIFLLRFRPPLRASCGREREVCWGEYQLPSVHTLSNMVDGWVFGVFDHDKTLALS